MKKELLIATTKELQEILVLEPELDVTLKPDELTVQVKEAATFLAPDDELTDETIEVLQELFIDSYDEIEKKGTVNADAKMPAIQVFLKLGLIKEPEEPDEKKTEDAGEKDDLFTEVDNAERMKDLKDITKSNDEFKEIRGELSKYKSTNELRDAMLDVLEAKPEETKSEPAPEKKEKSTAKRTVTPKGTGVIATIIETLKNKGSRKSGVSKDEILEVLKKKFPDRDEKSMKNTINVQVPNRINKERDFEVEKLKTGNFIVK